MGPRPRRAGRRAPDLNVPGRIPPLHLVATDDIAGDPAFSAAAAELLERGGSKLALHLRLLRSSGAALYELASRLAPIAAATGALLIVNDRVDVALAARCSGVQLGGRGMSVGDARHLLGRDARIGVSVHDPDAAQRAASQGADFLLVGTLYATATHPGAAANGLGLLRELSAVSIPRIGIGGVRPARVREAMHAGADGVAVVRGIWRAPSPGGALMEYLNQLHDA